MLPRHQIPNAVTLARIVLTLPILWLLWSEAYLAAVLLLAVAGLSDVLDGWLVRRYGWYTALGAWLDPAADKLLILGVYLVVTLSGLLPVWLLILVLGRDLWLALGSLLYRLRVGPLEPQPLVISKLNTFLQIVLILVVIAGAGGLAAVATVVPVLVALVAATTLASGVAYSWQWGRRARQALQGIAARDRGGA
ncbi:MAG: CDP-alcohol phosphatidyltransferase family protein [Pseudomonadota bacterium]